MNSLTIQTISHWIHAHEKRESFTSWLLSSLTCITLHHARILDAILPAAFVVFSLAINTHRRYRAWRSTRHRQLDPHTLRLPTSKDAALFRRSIALLVLVLLEISCWAFLFAWRLESAILERDNQSPKCGTSLYQVVDPGVALIPRFYMLILVLKSFSTPADPVSPMKFTLYNPHFLTFYTLACISANVRCFSYFFTDSDDNWVISAATEKSFAVVDLVICVVVWFVCATTPGELDQGELLDIDDAEDGILVLHDGRVVRSGRILSLEASASPLSSATFSWMNSLLYAGYKKPLDSEYLWALPFRQRAQENYRHFRTFLRSNNLVMRIYRANRKSIHLQFITANAAVIFHYANPFFLYKLLSYMENPEKHPPQAGYLFCGAIFLCNIISTLVASQTLLWGRRWHVTMNNMLNSEIYAHTLRQTTNSAFKAENDAHEDMDECTQSKQASLMSHDTERLAELASYLHIFYTCPLEIIADLAFLYYILGNAFLAGLIVMVVTLPSTHYINRKLVKVQKQLTEAKTWRIRLIKELLESIRVTKYMAWERKWEQIIMNARDDELVKLIKLYTRNTILSLIWFATPVFVTTISFAWYTLVEHKRLDPRQVTAFVSIVLFGMLRDPLNVMPQAVMAYNDAKVSLAHINTFLNSGEKRDSDSDSSNFCDDHSQRPYAEQLKTGFTAGIFQWTTTPPQSDDRESDSATPSIPFSLHLPNLDFPPGRLSIITGPRKSGKSSLLCALLGEMPSVSGIAYLPSRFLTPLTSCIRDEINASTFVYRVAYVPQTPWIQSGTVRENILFFEPWDDGRYRALLHHCDLLKDLSLLENGDLTLIGDGGTFITESLKQKISLARAVYSRAKTLLVDDIFTIFDRHTAAYLYDKCICGELMQSRTMILVTTDLGAWIRDARLLVRMDGGKISAIESEEGISDWIEANQMRADGSNSHNVVNDDRIDALFEIENAFGDDGVFDEASVMRESIRNTEDGMANEGKVRDLAYATYFAACGGWRFWLAATAFTVLARTCTISESYWLKERSPFLFWVWSTEDEQQRQRWTTKHYIAVYLGLCLITVMFNFIRTVIQYRGSMRGSNRLFLALLKSVCRAPVQFFENTSSGQIMSRFSKDIETVDTSIGWHVNFLLQTVFGVLGVVISIGIILPEVYIAFLVAGLCYYYIGVVYIRTSRELKKLNATSRLPIYSLYTDTLTGLATIRAFGEQRAMMRKMFQLLDENMRAFYTLWTTNRWLFVRVELVGAILSLFIGVLLIHKGTDAGLAGIALTFAASLLEYIYWLMRQSTTVDMHFESIERINEYVGMACEPPGIVEGSRPPAAVRDLTVAQDEEIVLKHVSFNVLPGEKVALVGRAGAEKNAIVGSLFQFAETRGSIKIDGVNIAWIGVEDLRSRLTYIAKDGIVSNGTIRSNLDPFGEYDEYELWQVLHRVGLAALGGASSQGQPMPNSIVHDLDMDSSALTVGQRQLLCIARALLRDCTRLVVFEEAQLTPDEEGLVHAVVQEEFAESTMLVILNRLESVTRYDRVMVFDQGALVEYDSPAELIDRDESLLRSLMERAGILDE
ncbi:ABC transporter type 1, transmembrane domain-containing protein [Dichotomocladium elegans]|nr:ABC transporter type 1, transmembrane domain-containing protein [Dichotomocladium elegans]